MHYAKQYTVQDNVTVFVCTAELSTECFKVQFTCRIVKPALNFMQKNAHAGLPIALMHGFTVIHIKCITPSSITKAVHYTCSYSIRENA